MSKKILMILGGSRYILPLIKSAHELDVFVITVDYIPNNIAHKYSDLYLNISVTDKEAVLKAAKHFNINGISSFACDPGVTTAAYVANKLNLPSPGPYESVCILQNKGLFRSFLSKNGFNVPIAKSYLDKSTALKDSESFSYPIIVKPVDSAGSKGVTRVDSVRNLGKAIDVAISSSITKSFIIEEFIEKQGCSSDSDFYSIDGKIVLATYSDQYFDEDSENPYVPAGFVWPSTMSKKHQSELTCEIQRLLTLLQMKTSIYNVEARVSKEGKPYIMEVSPRGGGNRIAEMIKYHLGIDLIKKHIADTVGLNDNSDLLKHSISKPISMVVLHSKKDGVFKGIRIHKNINDLVLEKDVWIKNETPIKSFKGANNSFGTVVCSMDAHTNFEDIKRGIEVVVK